MRKTLFLNNIFVRKRYVKLCAIWYHFWYHLFQPATLKVTLLHGIFSRFLNFENGTKLRNSSHMAISYGFTLKNEIHSR